MGNVARNNSQPAESGNGDISVDPRQAVTRLPDVIHVGYMRAGSTSLRNWFDAHPDINWTRLAWNFQLGGSDAERSTEYARLFQHHPAASNHAKCVVDMYESLCLGQYFREPINISSNRTAPVWSADWAVNPELAGDASPVAVDFAEVARRIRVCLPDGRILIVLRNQFDWFRSMYHHYRGHLPRGRQSPADFLATPEGAATRIAADYFRALSALFDQFGPSNVHVMLLEEWDQPEAVNRLCRFLAVPSCNRLTSERANQGSHRKLLRPWWLGGHRRRHDMPDELAELAQRYAESNRRVEQLTGMRLASRGYPT